MRKESATLCVTGGKNVRHSYDLGSYVRFVVKMSGNTSHRFLSIHARKNITVVCAMIITQIRCHKARKGRFGWPTGVVWAARAARRLGGARLPSWCPISPGSQGRGQSFGPSVARHVQRTRWTSPHSTLVRGPLSRVCLSGRGGLHMFRGGLNFRKGELLAIYLRKPRCDRLQIDGLNGTNSCTGPQQGTRQTRCRSRCTLAPPCLSNAPPRQLAKDVWKSPARPPIGTYYGGEQSGG